jgi:hypothetical protein
MKRWEPRQTQVDEDLVERSWQEAQHTVKENIEINIRLLGSK